MVIATTVVTADFHFSNGNGVEITVMVAVMTRRLVKEIQMSARQSLQII